MVISIASQPPDLLIANTHTAVTPVALMVANVDMLLILQDAGNVFCPNKSKDQIELMKYFLIFN